MPPTGDRDGQPYRGSAGATTRRAAQVSCPCGAMHGAEIVVGIDARRDPELAARLRDRGPEGINARPCEKAGGIAAEIHEPVVYHDPDKRQFFLVLPSSMRHREFEERARLLQRLAEDREADTPAYVRHYEIVWGREGLSEALERTLEAERDLNRQRQLRRDIEGRLDEAKRREKELENRSRELQRVTDELDSRSAKLTAHEIALNDRKSALDRRSKELEARTRALSNAEAEEVTQPESVDGDSREGSGDDEKTRRAGPVSARELAEDAEESILLEPRKGSSEVRTDPFQAPLNPALGVIAEASAAGEPPRSKASDEWLAARKPSAIGVKGSRAWLALRAEGPIDRELTSSSPRVLFQLHRMHTYPVISLTVGEKATFCFDVAARSHKAALDALAQDFCIRLEVWSEGGDPVAARDLRCPLEANVGYVVAAAQDARKQLPTSKRSFGSAMLELLREGVAARAIGTENLDIPPLPDARDGARLLAALDTYERLSAPEVEEQLIAVRGSSLRGWHTRRRSLLERAIAIGLVPGTALSRVAVSEGLARSRKELVQQLKRNFAIAASEGCGLTESDVAGNWEKLSGEARRLGLDASGLTPRSEPIHSEDEPTASGLISVSGQNSDELRSLLREPRQQVAAVEALARRQDVSALASVMAAIRHMERDNASAALAATVHYGRVAVPGLIDLLSSRKGYVRQGSALALAMIGEEDGVEATCDRMLVEPTRVWREMASAVGRVGAPAVMPLLARLSGQGRAGRDRLAWALAHICAQGGRRPIETLATGRDPVAVGVARRALEMAPAAADEREQVAAPRGVREVSVNRAFSRRFFEAMSRPGAVDAETSEPAMVLDDADLEDAEPLDEADLLPS